MNLIDRSELAEQLSRYAGRIAFTHVEAIPGAFVRNTEVTIAETFVAGDGPYRVALKLAGDGWIRVEGLTHCVVEPDGRLLLAGHDETGRLTVGLQLSERPFPA